MGGYGHIWFYVDGTYYFLFPEGPHTYGLCLGEDERNGNVPRWKSLAEQPVGWNPDLNDGVRLNIRPFFEAGVLREKAQKLNIKWGKDRGKDVESAPWYAVFHGDRINDHHTTLAEKAAAREEK